VSPVKSVERKRKHDEPSVCPGVCSIRIDAALPNGSSSPSTIGNAARGVRADGGDVGAMHHDLRIRERARHVGGSVAVVGMLVRDQRCSAGDTAPR